MLQHVFLPLLLLTTASAFTFPEDCTSWSDDGGGTACCNAIKQMFADNDDTCIVTADGQSLVELRLNSNPKVSGQIDPDIFGHQAFKQLITLDLSANSLNGTMPTSLAGLQYIENIDFSNNNPGFSGKLGSEGLYHMESLKVVDFSGNSDLAGSINGVMLPKLTNLRQLKIQNCKLSGNIPTEIGQLSNLVRLVLNGNQLTGTLPKELGNLSNLQYLELNDNRLNGEIPKELANALRLQFITMERQGGSADGSGFTGSLPQELGNLPDLTTLELEGNQLSGPIPESLFPANGKLHTLDLHNNQLTGGIPKVIKNCQILEQVFLNKNKLSGEIPPELGHIENLIFVDISENELSGKIPSEVLNLPQLYYFNAAKNNLNSLDSNIGSGAGTNSPLHFLYLNDNQLEGSLPDGLKNFLKLGQLHLENNRLCGNVTDLHGTTSLEQILMGGNSFACPVPNYCNWMNGPTNSTCDWKRSYGDAGNENCGNCGGTSTALIVVLVLLFAGVLGGGAYWFTLRRTKPKSHAFEQL